MGGDDTLWNTLGSERSVDDLVIKVLQAWDCESMSVGTLISVPDFGLEQFLDPSEVNAMLVPWLNGRWKAVALIFFGKGGLGKTEFACALMA